MEHRWGERIATDIPIRLTLARSTLIGLGRLINLSLSGALIDTSVELRVFSRIQVVLKPPQFSKTEPANIAAYVTRRHDGAFGVEWVEFAPPAVTEIVRMTTLRSAASVPQLMQAHR
jgi:PilZ domain